jgi:hypothetical protein
MATSGFCSKNHCSISSFCSFFKLTEQRYIQSQTRIRGNNFTAYLQVEYTNTPPGLRRENPFEINRFCRSMTPQSRSGSLYNSAAFVLEPIHDTVQILRIKYDESLVIYPWRLRDDRIHHECTRRRLARDHI